MFDPEPEGWKVIPVRGFFRTIGPLWARRQGDGWTYGLLTTGEHDNSAGVVHGGVLTAFVDQAFSTVAWEAAGRRAASTVTLDVQFASPVRPGAFVAAQARVVRTGASLIFLTGAVVSGDREVVMASGVWSIVR